MKKFLKKGLIFCMITLIIASAASLLVFAENETNIETIGAVEETTTETEEKTDSLKSVKAISAAIAIGLAATAGAIGMAIAISKSNEGISRQPEAAGNIRTSLMLGLVFIETAIIYALIIAILIIFVL